MAELTREEVLKKAEELGIEHHKTAKTTAIVKMIEDLTGETLEVKEQKTRPKDGTIRCIIHSNDRENDEREVRGSINGDTFQVQIGEEIDFPKKFIPCIEDAKEDEKIAILDEDGTPTGKYKERQRRRYIIERV